MMEEGNSKSRIPDCKGLDGVDVERLRWEVQIDIRNALRSIHCELARQNRLLNGEPEELPGEKLSDKVKSSDFQI